MSDANLTERQRKWFESVRGNLERETGRSLAEWAVIARTCPETGHRARLAWFKATYGLNQNRASVVLAAAFEGGKAWDRPDDLVAALWTDAAARAIHDAVDRAAMALPDTIRTARKGFTAWSRAVQFAALKPVKGGHARLGLALPADADPRLEAARREAWSERLVSAVGLDRPEAVDDGLKDLIRQAWDRSR